MSIKKSLLAAGIGLSFLTAGCSPLFGEPATSTEEGAEAEVNEDGLVSVTEYTGEGYGLNGHDEEEEIGLANRDEVEEAAKSYMKEFYNTDVEVQRIFGSPGAVTVIVRSTKEPVFNTYVIVPVDVESRKVEGEKTFSDKNQVEIAIISGLYYIAYKDEFETYKKNMESFAEQNDLDVLSEETLTSIDFSGYSSPYVTIFPGYKDFESIVEEYLKENQKDGSYWREQFRSLKFRPDRILIKTEFYMAEGEVPNQDLYEQILNEIKGLDYLPKGEYTPSLYDHTIEPKSGTNNVNNSIVLSNDKILKNGYDNE